MVIKPTKKDIELMRKSFRNNPELAHLAPHVVGGMNILNYMFAALDKAGTVKAPKGIALGDLSVRAKNPKSKKAAGEIEVAGWLIEALKNELNYKEK